MTDVGTKTQACFLLFEHHDTQDTDTYNYRVPRHEPLTLASTAKNHIALLQF